MQKNIKKIGYILTLSLVLPLFIASCYQEQKKKTKQILEPKNVQIVATLGKNGWERVNAYCESGANIFRINGSHIKSEEQLKQTLEEVNKAIKSSDKCKNISVMYDTQGPEIRTIILEKKEEKVEVKKEEKKVKNDKKSNKKDNKKNKKDKKIKNSKNKDKKIVKEEKKEEKFIINNPASYEIRENDVLIVHTNLNDEEVFYKGDRVRENGKQKTIHIGVNYVNFIKDVKKDMILTIENRLIYAKVENVDKNKGIVKLVITEINNEEKTYNLTDRRHINLIGEPVSLETLTENDKKYIKMSALAGVEYYAISFVRNGKDIIEVKELIKNTFKENGIGDNDINDKMKKIKIIAKIETKQGLDSLTEIVKTADGAMVARGDLASEIPFEAVPYAKYKIIKKCNHFGKFSILATDVLESMTRQNQPSRNDVDVVITSLQLGVDAVMLSNETTQGGCACKGVKAIKELKKLIDFDHNFMIARLQKYKEKEQQGKNK